MVVFGIVTGDDALHIAVSLPSLLEWDGEGRSRATPADFGRMTRASVVPLERARSCASLVERRTCIMIDAPCIVVLRLCVLAVRRVADEAQVDVEQKEQARMWWVGGDLRRYSTVPE